MPEFHPFCRCLSRLRIVQIVVQRIGFSCNENRKWHCAGDSDRNLIVKWFFVDVSCSARCIAGQEELFDDDPIVFRKFARYLSVDDVITEVHQRFKRCFETGSAWSSQFRCCTSTCRHFTSICWSSREIQIIRMYDRCRSAVALLHRKVSVANTSQSHNYLEATRILHRYRSNRSVRGPYFDWGYSHLWDVLSDKVDHAPNRIWCEFGLSIVGSLRKRCIDKYHSVYERFFFLMFATFSERKGIWPQQAVAESFCHDFCASGIIQQVVFLRPIFSTIFRNMWPMLSAWLLL